MSELRMEYPNVRFYESGSIQIGELVWLIYVGGDKTETSVGCITKCEGEEPEFDQYFADRRHQFTLPELKDICAFMESLQHKEKIRKYAR